jgi:GAF domain-containing protein
VAANVGEDAVRLTTAELPDTRSEAAIPLRSRGRVLGALTVQSEKSGAFGDMEIATFQALADQLAIALDNARLIAESQAAVEEAQRAYGHISRSAWSDYIRSGAGGSASRLAASGNTSRGLAYRYELGQSGVVGGQDARLSPEAFRSVEEARLGVLQSGRPARLSLASQALLLLPIQVRGQVIGVANFTKNRPAPGTVTQLQDASSQWQTPAWKEDEVGLLETILEQLGIAMDSARLYQDSQRLAFREQLVGEVTGRIRQTLDLETVMRTAVEEIQRTLNLPEVVISLVPPEEDPSLRTPQFEAITADPGLSEVSQ